jgi:hypothetical protein
MSSLGNDFFAEGGLDRLLLAAAYPRCDGSFNNRIPRAANRIYKIS